MKNNTTFKHILLFKTLQMTILWLVVQMSGTNQEALPL